MIMILKNKSGGVPIVVIGLLFLMLLVAFLIMEMGYAYESYYDAETILQRCCNNAVEYNMLDEYRADHILKLDLQGAERDFAKFMDSDLPNKYTITIKSVSGTESPPNLTVTGSVTFPTLFSKYGFNDIVFEFKVESNNFRIG